MKKKKQLWKTTWAILSILFLLAGSLTLISSSGQNLECTKNANYQTKCVLTKMLAMELIPDEKLIINPLQSAVIEQKIIQKEIPGEPPYYQKISIYRVVLKNANNNIPINDFSDNLQTQQVAASQINNFIQNKHEFSLIIKKDNFLRLGIMGLVMITIGIMIAITTFS